MTLVAKSAPSPILGEAIRYTAYLPPGYSTGVRTYPTVYLLHGRGDTSLAWARIAPDLDELITAGTLEPLVAVMPDAPWSDRGSWYVDSLYTGVSPAGSGAGRAVEGALTRDLVRHVDATFRTIDDRAARVIGGYSMGGSGALRFALAHQNIFSAVLVLSPAVYVPAPPMGSATRAFGAFGVGSSLFTQSRYDELNYPAALAALDSDLPMHLFIACGDNDYRHPAPEDARHDLDAEATALHAAACRTPGVTSQLRILPGEHDWAFWRLATGQGLVYLFGRLTGCGV